MLKDLDNNISYIKHEINKIEWDVDTWSYAIMGNKEAERIDENLTLIMLKYITVEEGEYYSHDYPDSMLKIFFERAFNEIVSYVLEQNSRLAFQVLGWNILFFGAKLPDDIRELILLHSEWKDEEDQFLDERDREERWKFLLDFRDNIINYKDGFPIRIPLETEREVYRKNREKSKDGLVVIDRQAINYRKYFEDK